MNADNLQFYIGVPGQGKENYIIVRLKRTKAGTYIKHEADDTVTTKCSWNCD